MRAKAPVPSNPQGLDGMKRDRRQTQTAQCMNIMPTFEFIQRNWIIFLLFSKDPRTGMKESKAWLLVGAASDKTTE